MKMEDVRVAVLRSVGSILDDESAKIDLTSRLEAQLGVDSTEIVEILVDLEKKLQISLKGVRFADLDTVGDLVTVVAGRIVEPIS